MVESIDAIKEFEGMLDDLVDYTEISETQTSQFLIPFQGLKTDL